MSDSHTMLTAAAFSGYVGQLLSRAAVTDAFPYIKRRAVAVLREEDFPLLAVWVESDDENDDAGSDGEAQYATEYTFLVASRLGDDEAQDEVLGKLIKIVRDAAAAMQVDNVTYRVGRWDADNNVADGEGDRVWAEFGVTITHYRPTTDY